MKWRSVFQFEKSIFLPSFFTFLEDCAFECYAWFKNESKLILEREFNRKILLIIKYRIILILYLLTKRINSSFLAKLWSVFPWFRTWDGWKWIWQIMFLCLKYLTVMSIIWNVCFNRHFFFDFNAFFSIDSPVYYIFFSKQKGWSLRSIFLTILNLILWTCFQTRNSRLSLIHNIF